MISASALHQVRHILRSFPIPACILDREPRYIAANQKYADIFNENLDGLIGNLMADFSPPRFVENVHRDFRTFDAGRTVPDHEIELDGKRYLVSVGSIPAEHTREIIAISVALTDITRLKQIEHELEQALHTITDISETDPLTGLRNRYAFEKYLEQEITRSKRTGMPTSAIFIDVDCFKAYNDLYGHVEGDTCLQTVAKAIQQGARRPGDILARYGGEEFAVILPNTNLSGAIATANQIKDALTECSIKHEGSPHQYLSVSMGVFCLPVMPYSQETAWLRKRLLNGADRALYRAKDSGRNTIHADDMGGTNIIQQRPVEPL